jgi:signal transduction histidine kinase/putative methionine-R-sulfoxide reductase with GAF domain
MDALREYERPSHPNGRLELLAHTARALLTEERPRDLLRGLFQQLSAHLGLEVYLNYWLTEDGSALRLDSYAGVPDQLARQLARLEPGQAVCGAAAARSARLVVEDVQASTDPLTGPVRSLGITAYACYPLLARGRLLGTLSFGTRRRPRFAPDEVEFMQAVADLIAAALERQRAETALAERARLEALRADVGGTMAEGGGLRTCLERSAQAIVRHLGAAFARIWTLNQETNVLELQASAGMYTHTDGPHSRVPVGQLKVGRIAQERQPVLTNDVLNDSRISDRDWARREGMVAFAGYPLIVEGQVVGVAAMFARSALSPAILMALASVSDGIALTIRRQQAEEALRAHAERQRFLAEASRLLAASLDYETTLESVARLAVPGLADYCIVDLLDTERATRAVAVAHADPAKEVLAREMRTAFPPDPDRGHPVWEAFRTGRPQLLAEVGESWFQAIARGPRHLELMRRLGPRSQIITPLVARDRALGVITFVYADSARRYGPADLALADELAGRMALAVDNAWLYREAHEAARAREAFLARASHELRTPLTSALGTVRLLRRARPGWLPESPEALLAVVDRGLTAMAALINDLLDASKLASGQESVAHEPLDVADPVGRSLEVVRPQAHEKGVTLRAAVAPRLALSADRLKLEQVLVNLVANAVKFTPAGGAVTVEAEQEGDSVVLRVRDTGEGIAPDQLERIFEPFYQAGGLGDARTTDRRARRVRGTGLGLAICRQIVALHGGTIHAESEGPGRGATFVVRLPAVPAGSRAA